MILLFDSVVGLACLEMEQVFCKDIFKLYQMICNMLNSMEALTYKQGKLERDLSRLPDCAQNRLLFVLLRVIRFEQHSVRHLVWVQKDKH